MAFHVLAIRPLSFLSPDDMESYNTKEIDVFSDHYGHDFVLDDVYIKRFVGPDKICYKWSLLVNLNSFILETTLISY